MAAVFRGREPTRPLGSAWLSGQVPEQALRQVGAICIRRGPPLAGSSIWRSVDPALEARGYGRWLREAAIGLAAFGEAAACLAARHLASTPSTPAGYR